MTYEPYVVPPVVGTIVRVPTEARIAGLHVVVGDGTSHGRVVAKIAKLGGDGNRYWRVTPDKLVEVSLEDVKELLPA